MKDVTRGTYPGYPQVNMLIKAEKEKLSPLFTGICYGKLTMLAQGCARAAFDTAMRGGGVFLV